MDAAYVLHVEFQLTPSGVSVSPNRFETTMEVPAVEPGTQGWLFFRNRLWRGELGDPGHYRDVASDRLGVDVVAVDFRELRTDQEYLDALRAEIGEDLTLFKADSVEEVIRKYLGSSIHVRD